MIKDNQTKTYNPTNDIKKKNFNKYLSPALILGIKIATEIRNENQ